MGVLTLVMGCVFISLWFRSYFVLHAIEIPIGKSSIGATSQGGSLTLDYSYPLGEHSTQIQRTLYYNSFAINRGNGPVYDGTGLTHLHEVYWNWNVVFFGIASAKLIDCHNYGIGIPYWSLALACSLCAARLLLSKQRSEQTEPAAKANSDRS